MIIQVRNRRGIHGRVACLLVNIANRYTSQVSLSQGGQIADGRSVMDIMALGAAPGSEVELEIEGEDAEALTREITNQFDKRFDEDQFESG